MTDSEFVHLHVHSQYSMLDGAIRLKPLVEQAKQQGMSALALTDHGNMFGAVQFTSLCNANGVRPILGCEVNLVPLASKGAASDGAQSSYHLVLLVDSQEGYHNLARLVSLGWVQGLVKGVPRVDLEMLAAHRKGLVCMTGCMGGFVAQEVLRRGPQAGRHALATLRDAVEPGSLYVELQDHGLIEQKPLGQILVSLANELQLPTVATNDCHYLRQDEAKAQLVLQCIAAGRTLDEVLPSYHGRSDMFFKPAQMMVERFAHVPEAIRNTLVIAERCAGAANPFAAPKLPRFAVPEGSDEQQYLRSLARRGLETRFQEFVVQGRARGSWDEAAYKQRLDMECDVICSMGFAGYFLIVQDFINWAKEREIPVGPGRGSGAGSLVSFALRITDLDPILYGLLFERFLNPERVSMPDFDVDFCMDRRDEVIQYVRAKYGEQSVGQIATFHLLKSRSVVRDVGRVMGMSVQEAGRIASLVPEPVQGKTVSIEKAMEQEPRLQAVYDESPNVRELLDTAKSLEELTRHAGMHAAGIVISSGALWDHVPVFCPEPGEYVTQYSKDDVESAGLVKFDFLGLKTLTVIQIATRLINKRPDIGATPFRIDRIPLDDKATFALLQSGETTNVFQLESSGMQSLFKQLKPDTFEDIVAAVALYRPGPLGSGMVEDFVQRKHKRVKVEYPHPSLQEVLQETYGVIVYQEQVMQAAQKMAGYTLGGADLLRRAMGKKKPEEMAKQKETFVQGAVASGYAAHDAEKVFELIAYFAGYGFNKSHSAAYALISYQTAYLKAYYPVEFICATLTADKDKIDKVVRTVAEAQSMGIRVLQPDVNESEIDFTVVYETGVLPAVVDAQPSSDTSSTPSGSATKNSRKNKPISLKGKLHDPCKPTIRFGLGGIKGVGSAALEAIFEARAVPSDDVRADPRGRFVDLFEFASRVDLRRVNKAVVEALVQCGAFDAMHQTAGIHRAKALASIEAALEYGKKAQYEKQSGQTSLFEMLGGSASSRSLGPTRYVDAAPWDSVELLARERSALGFYVSGHPLQRYQSELARCASAHSGNVATFAEGAEVRLGGMVEGYRERPTRNGGKIGFFWLEDAMGRVEVIVRPQKLESVRATLEANEPVLVSGQVQYERDRRNGGPGGYASNAGGGSGGGAGGRSDGNGVTDGEESEAAAAPKLVLEDVQRLADTVKSKAQLVRIRLEVERADAQLLEKLRTVLGSHGGKCPVDLELASSEDWSVLLRRVSAVDPSESLVASLERLCGKNVCEFRWGRESSSAA
jgi:DNA polymerase-3 subunit alpha